MESLKHAKGTQGPFVSQFELLFEFVQGISLNHKKFAHFISNEVLEPITRWAEVRKKTNEQMLESSENVKSHPSNLKEKLANCNNEMDSDYFIQSPVETSSIQTFLAVAQVIFHVLFGFGRVSL